MPRVKGTKCKCVCRKPGEPAPVAEGEAAPIEVVKQRKARKSRKASSKAPSAAQLTARANFAEKAKQMKELKAANPSWSREELRAAVWKK